MRAFKRRTDTGSSATLAAVQDVFATPSAVAESAPAVAPPVTEGFPTPTVGAVVDVPLSHIEKSKYNARRIVAPARNESLAQSMQADHQLVPVAAYVLPNGRIGLIDGQRRYEAQRRCGGATLRCEIHAPPADDRALYLASRRANVERETQSPLDDALVWQDLLRDGVFASQVELARAIGETETTVSRTLGLLAMPARFLHMIAERPELLTLRMLDALKRFHGVAGDEALERMICEADHNGLSSRDVDARRKAIERGPVSRARSDQSTLQFERGQATIKHFEGQGRLQIEIGAVKDPVTAQLLHDRLRALISEVLGEAGAG